MTGHLVLGALLFIVGSILRVDAQARGNFWQSFFSLLGIGFGGGFLILAFKIEINFLWTMGFYAVWLWILSRVSNWWKNKNSNQTPS